MSQRREELTRLPQVRLNLPTLDRQRPRSEPDALIRVTLIY